MVGRLENDATLTFSVSTDGTNFSDETVTLYADDTASNNSIISLVETGALAKRCRRACTG